MVIFEEVRDEWRRNVGGQVDGDLGETSIMDSAVLDLREMLRQAGVGASAQNRGFSPWRTGARVPPCAQGRLRVVPDWA